MAKKSGFNTDLKVNLICYPKCGTCKKARAFLESKAIVFEERNIKEERPTAEELKKWISASGLPLKRFFNTSGQMYRELQVKDRLETMTEQEAIELLASDGMLVRRPLLIVGDRVLTGFKETEWESVFEVRGN